MNARTLLVIALVLCSAPTRAADEGPYLFDLLKQPPYLAAWNGMLKGESVPAWGQELRQDFRRRFVAVEDCDGWRQNLHARLGMQGA